MVSKQFKNGGIIKRKKLAELINYYALAFLQMKIDYEDELLNPSSKINEKQLKIIAIDKLLKLYYEGDYICIYSNDDKILLTKDEISYLVENTSKKNLTFIKNDLISEDNIRTRIKGYILISKSKNNIKTYTKLVQEIL